MDVIVLLTAIKSNLNYMQFEYTQWTILWNVYVFEMEMYEKIAFLCLFQNFMAKKRVNNCLRRKSV